MYLSFNINRQMLNQAFSVNVVNDWQVKMRNPFLILNLVAFHRRDSFFRSITSLTLSKPPNILVYCKPSEFVNIKQTLLKVVNSDRYVIYHLQESKIFGSNIWADNIELLVIKKTKMDNKIAEQLIKFYERGGKLFSMDLAYFHRFFLDLNKRELMTVIQNDKPVKKLKKVYYKDKKIKLMCVQPQFVWNLEGEFETIAVDRLYKPLIFAKRYEDTTGCFVSSLVDLEYDFERRLVRDEWYNDLKESDETRLKIIKDILSQNLQLDCSHVNTLPLTPCYLLGDTQDVNNFLHRMSAVFENNKFKSHLLTMAFCDRDKPSDVVTSDYLPVIYNYLEVHGFNLEKYLFYLESQRMGKVIFFTQVLPSTMNIISGLTDQPRVIAVAKRQTQGKGRSGNDWLSPDGCAMFSVPLVFNRKTELGIHPTWLQHLAALSIVDAVLNTPDYQDLDVRIKWPNDVYIGQSKMKIGGVVVTCTLIKDTFHCVIGCGLNVSNSVPTTCLNDLILQRNMSNPWMIPLGLFTVEEIIAKIVSRLEELVDQFQISGYKDIVDLYCSRWMHGGADVSLQDGRKVRILGLDSNGFLTVLDNGEIVSLQSADWNSFDLMRNLITCKQ